MTAKKIDIPEVVATGLLESAGRVRLTDDSDDSKYIDMAVSPNRNFTVTEADNLIVQGRDSATFVQIQRAGATSDDTNTGLSIGVNNNDGYIYNRAGSGKLYIASSNSVAITIDAAENATFVANLSTNGNATLGDAADDAHTVNGTLALASEHSTGPSAPAAGAGGILYVKTDGKLYFVSDDVAETDLTGGGGGAGLTILSKSNTDSPYTAAAGQFVEITSGPFTLNLPAATTAGDVIDVFIKDALTNAVTISPDGSDTINYSSADLRVSGNARVNYTFVSSGSNNWFIR